MNRYQITLTPDWTTETFTVMVDATDVDAAFRLAQNILFERVCIDVEEIEEYGDCEDD